MAGDWIKWSKGLTRKMEILQMSARLHIAPAHAAGTLMQLMEWVDENVSVFDSDGNAHVTLGPLQSSALDVTLGVSGFMEAMAEVGWIRIENDDLVFVHAERHNGKTAKARALTKERVAAHRNGDVTHRALPEKRREEDSMLPLGDTVTAERIYDEYPRKIARPKAIEAIKRAAQLVATKANHAGFPDAMAYLLDRTLAYSKATAQWSIEDRQFIPHPTTWFNQGRFDDDPATWVRKPQTYANHRNSNGRSFEQQQDYSGVREKL
jgi:hypothetical protein